MKRYIWNRNIKDKKKYVKVKCSNCKQEDYLSDNINGYLCEQCIKKKVKKI